VDANALMLPVRNQFPLEAEVDRLLPGSRLAVPSSVLDEIRELVHREVRGARSAAELARKFPVLPNSGKGDAAIVDSAVRERATVVTADRELANRLRARGLSVLIPRDRHRLELRRGARTRSAPDTGA